MVIRDPSGADNARRDGEGELLSGAPGLSAVSGWAGQREQVHLQA